MKNIFIICFSFNVVFGIGLKALIIPQSALTLASSNTGIDHNINVDINPASLSYLNPYMGFSKNNWFGDLEGQKISILKNHSYNYLFKDVLENHCWKIYEDCEKSKKQSCWC